MNLKPYWHYKRRENNQIRDFAYYVDFDMFDNPESQLAVQRWQNTESNAWQVSILTNLPVSVLPNNANPIQRLIHNENGSLHLFEYHNFTSVYNTATVNQYFEELGFPGVTADNIVRQYFPDSSVTDGVNGGEEISDYIDGIFYNANASRDDFMQRACVCYLATNDETVRQQIKFLYGAKPSVKWLVYYDILDDGNFITGHHYNLTVTWQIDDYDGRYDDCEYLIQWQDAYKGTTIFEGTGAPNYFYIPWETIETISTLNEHSILKLAMTIPDGDGTYGTDICNLACPVPHGYLFNAGTGPLLPTTFNIMDKSTHNDNSTLEIKAGKPEEDEDYVYVEPVNDEESNPSNIDASDIVSTIGVGTNNYAISRANFSALVKWLWTSTWTDNIKLVNNNPIENIISAKLFPFSLGSGLDTTVTLGNVGTPISAELLGSDYNRFYKQVVSNARYEGFYRNFLDYAPYTAVSIYLPYIGIKELDASLIADRSIDVWYTFDVTSGSVVADLQLDGNTTYMFEGVIGVDLPLTSTNRAQTDSTYAMIGAGAVLTAVGGVAGVASAVSEGAAVGTLIGIGAKTAGTALGELSAMASVQYHSSTVGSFSPNALGLLSKDAYLIINRPTYQDIDAFNHVEGRFCLLSRYISSLSGYTVVHSNVDLSGIPADAELKERLRQVLCSGFFA